MIILIKLCSIEIYVFNWTQFFKCDLDCNVLHKLSFNGHETYPWHLVMSQHYFIEGLYEYESGMWDYNGKIIRHVKFDGIYSN